MNIHAISDEEKLDEYVQWITRVKKNHDVGFHVDNQSWADALAWSLERIYQLKEELQAKAVYIKMLEQEVR